MFDIITIAGLGLSLMLLMVLVPLCPLSIVCPPFCLCSLPTLMGFIATTMGLITYWASGGMPMTSSSYTPGSIGGGLSGMRGMQ
jgi:hypothetical protein